MGFLAQPALTSIGTKEKDKNKSIFFGVQSRPLVFPPALQRRGV